MIYEIGRGIFINAAKIISVCQIEDDRENYYVTMEDGTKYTVDCYTAVALTGKDTIKALYPAGPGEYFLTKALRAVGDKKKSFYRQKIDFWALTENGEIHPLAIGDEGFMDDWTEPNESWFIRQDTSEWLCDDEAEMMIKLSGYALPKEKKEEM